MAMEIRNCQIKSQCFDILNLKIEKMEAKEDDLAMLLDTMSDIVTCTSKSKSQWLIVEIG